MQVEHDMDARPDVFANEGRDPVRDAGQRRLLSGPVDERAVQVLGRAAAVGRPVQFIAPYNGSLSVKYTPVRGAAKGFSANVGVTFVGTTPTDAPNAGDTYATTPGTGARVVTRMARSAPFKPGKARALAMASSA